MLDEEVEALRSQKSQYVAKRESISAELEAYTTEMAGLRVSLLDTDSLYSRERMLNLFCLNRKASRP